MLNKVICGDYIKEIDNLEDNSIDMVLFSPPYDNIRTYNNNWNIDLNVLGKSLYRIVKDGGVCCVVINDSTLNFSKSLTSFRLAVNWVDSIGWKLFETIIYNRPGRPGAWWNTRFRVDHEYIFIFFKGDRLKTFNKDHLMIPSKHSGRVYTGTNRLTNGNLREIPPTKVNPMKCRGTVWQYATSNTEGNRLKLQHPATFPDKLASDLILAFSKEGDTVLDPMCGSGTTCVEAKKSNRNYICIDISEIYCEIAKERIANEA